MSFAISGLLTFATIPPASGVACTKKEIATFKALDSEMSALYFRFSDEGEVFPFIDAAKKATKNKKPLALYKKLEQGVEQGEKGRTGKSKAAWSALETTIKYKRC